MVFVIKHSLKHQISVDTRRANIQEKSLNSVMSALKVLHQLLTYKYTGGYIQEESIISAVFVIKLSLKQHLFVDTRGYIQEKNLISVMSAEKVSLITLN